MSRVCLVIHQMDQSSYHVPHPDTGNSKWPSCSQPSLGPSFI